MQVVILCGGKGIRLDDQISFIPKGMVKIDDKPVLWHIMKKYALSGHNEFILALGDDGDVIRDYFLNYSIHETDVSFLLGDTTSISELSSNQEESWKITFVNTGKIANTGARLSRCMEYIESPNFFLTYSDCLCDVDVNQVYKQHQDRDCIATITGVIPPFRYGEFTMKGDKVVNFIPISKLKASGGHVNGGFGVCSKNIEKYLSSYNESTLEKEVFQKLAKDGQLSVFKHNGFWQCLDNQREYNYLRDLCETNQRHWLHAENKETK